MAGMLPGVEAARRRRINHRGCGGGGGGWSELSAGGLVGGHGCTRRPVFCLFASSFEAKSSPAISAERSGMTKRTCQDEMLGRLAKEAKDRLDERLRSQKSSLVKRNNNDISEERMRCIDGRTMMLSELKTVVFNSKRKKKLFLLRWASRIGGKKSTESQEGEGEGEEECAVCLEYFKAGQTLVNLTCSHRFHSSCLLPWLQVNALCPCCRTTILP